MKYNKKKRKKHNRRGNQRVPSAKFPGEIHQSTPSKPTYTAGDIQQQHVLNGEKQFITTLVKGVIRKFPSPPKFGKIKLMVSGESSIPFGGIISKSIPTMQFHRFIRPTYHQQLSLGASKVQFPITQHNENPTATPIFWLQAKLLVL